MFSTNLKTSFGGSVMNGCPVFLVQAVNQILATILKIEITMNYYSSDSGFIQLMIGKPFLTLTCSFYYKSNFLSRDLMINLPGY